MSKKRQYCLITAGHVKIKMCMQTASRVKWGRAVRAKRAAGQIVLNGEFRAAIAAQNSFFIELAVRPYRVISTAFFIMTAFTGIILPAAVKLNRNNIFFGMVMDTACIVIQNVSKYIDTMSNHKIPTFVQSFISIITNEKMSNALN